MGDCTSLLDRSISSWRPWVCARSAPGGRTQKPLCSFVWIPRRSTKWRICRRSGERTWVERFWQLWIRDWLASHRDLVSRVVEGGASSLGYVAGNAVWLFAVPVLAIFFLLDGRETARAIAATLEPRGEPTLITRILRRVDTMLGKYMRAQSALAGLSFLFYSISLLSWGFRMRSRWASWEAFWNSFPGSDGSFRRRRCYPSASWLTLTGSGWRCC